MKPNKKGWLTEYLNFRKDLLRDLSEESREASHPDQSLYKIIQPTGVMYGQSVDLFDHPDSKFWGQKDRLKILLAESLVGSSFFFQGKSINDPNELSDAVLKALENIGNFYNTVFPEVSVSSRTFFGRKKTPAELAEKILTRRVEMATDGGDSFWSKFFNNSLLFLDIFIFGQWIHTNANKIVSDFFKYEREELRFSVIKVITAAAHANKRIEEEERKMFDYFIEGSGLSEEKKKEAYSLFKEGIEIEEVSLPTNNSWILKKYFLEVAILVVWADKKFEDVELGFLDRVAKHLDISAEELENSLVAVEGFVLEHWEQLDYLQSKQSYEEVSEQYMTRVSKIVDQNKDRLISEVRGSNELVVLLKKARSMELSDDEKTKTQELLLTVFKTIPTFVITSLPQKYLTLPIMMKILPSTFFSESLEHH